MPRTVLVVDDERDTNDILASLVQARGFEPIQVFSGAEALAAVAEQKPDLILLDLMLPDIDGFELCDRLKRARETNLIPIVMVTALQDAHHRAAGVRVGANGYLTKPFTPAAALRDHGHGAGLARGAREARHARARSTSTSAAS